MTFVATAVLVVSVLMAALAGCAGKPDTPGRSLPVPYRGDIDLAGWKLTIPEENDEGNAGEVEPAGLTPPWLTEDESGGLEFWAPATGATTENSDHPRTELIRLSHFRAGMDVRTLRASVTPSRVPQDGQGIILGQIHGAAELSSVPYVMLRYQDEQVKVVVKDTRKGDARALYPLLANVPLNSRFDFTLTDSGDGMMIFTGTRDGRTSAVRAPVPAPFTGATVRFQAGSYQQSDDPDGHEDGGRVVFHQLVESAEAPTPPSPPG